MNVIHTDNNGVEVRAAEEEPDVGHVYSVDWTDQFGGTRGFGLRFQTGPVKKAGINGPTTEALLAILIHRTHFLHGKFSCPENEVAIDHMRSALAALEFRTTDRLDRGVEGKNEP